MARFNGEIPMSNTNTELTTEQQKAIINTKETIELLEDVMIDIGVIRAFDYMSKLANVSNLKTLQKIKESKAYKGLTYRDDNNKLCTVNNWDEFCKYKLLVSRSTIDRNLLDLRKFGEEFFEASKRMGLGSREMRKLRQASDEDRTQIIESEAFKTGDVDALKEQLEDLDIQRKAELAEKQKELDETKRDRDVARDMSMDKQRELDGIAERKAKRRFDQEPWEQEVTSSFDGLMLAGSTIVQGVNQIKDIFYDLIKNTELGDLDQKSIQYIRKGIFSKIKECNEYFNKELGEALAVLGELHCDDDDFDCNEFFLKIECPELFEDDKSE